MKKEVIKFIRTFGCDVAYSGKTQRMYVRGANKRFAAHQAKKIFENLDFEITYNA